MGCWVKLSVIALLLALVLLTEAKYSKNDVEIYKELIFKCKVKAYMQCSGGKARSRGRWLCDCPEGYSCDYSPETRAFLCMPDDPTSDYDSVMNRIA